MAENNGALQQIHKPNLTLESLFAALDPKSYILSQNSNSLQPKQLQVTPFQRGPRYRAYAELRESKLRMKNRNQQFIEPELTITPPKKRVTFQGSVPVNSHNGASIVARSVPDFCAALRKENRKPVSTLPSMLEMTPPPSKASKGAAAMSKLGGSKSASAGEKRGGGGGMIMRKSYASFEELKGLSSAAASAINGEGRRGRSTRVINKNVLCNRQY